MNPQRLPVHNINVSDSVFSDFSFFKQERNPPHDGAHEIIRWKDPRHTICSHTGPIDYLRNPGTQPCPLLSVLTVSQSCFDTNHPNYCAVEQKNVPELAKQNSPESDKLLSLRVNGQRTTRVTCDSSRPL